MLQKVKKKPDKIILNLFVELLQTRYMSYTTKNSVGYLVHEKCNWGTGSATKRLITVAVTNESMWRHQTDRFKMKIIWYK